SYSRSQFITKVTPEFVDFKTPSRPSFVLMVNPREYISRVHLEWIGKHIPRGDARWLGELLARLSPEQIRAAFRAAGYSSQEIEGFSKIAQSRIPKLNGL